MITLVALNMIEFQELSSPEGISLNEHTDKAVIDGGYVKFGNIGAVYPRCFQNHYSKVKDFTVYPDDVWIITFPKSGTTWTQEIVWCLVNKMDLEGAKVNLNDRVPFFEYSCMWTPKVFSSTYIPEAQTKAAEFVPTYGKVEKLSRPRLIKSHLHYDFLPNEIYSKKPKIIYVTRNPKDVCVSFYHHSCLVDGYTGTIDEFVSSFITDNVFYAPYWQHLKDFWKLRDDPNILFLKYEDMKADLTQVIQRIANFLQVEISAENIQILKSHVSFENMKDNPAVNKATAIDNFKKIHGKEHPTKFMRQGKIGSWKTELSPDSIKKMDQWIAENGLSDMCSI